MHSPRGLAALFVVASPLAATAVLSSGLDTRPANPSCVAPARPGSGPFRVQLEPLFPGLAFGQPLVVLETPTDPQTWYVAARHGQVQRVLEVEGQAPVPNLALDITDRVISTNEGGLLGMALHPDFASNGQLFASYTTPGPSDEIPFVSVISRFVSEDGGVSFDPASEKIILRVDQPSTIHNGGDIHFAADGMLTIGLGDGGDHTKVQGPVSLLGSFLRIDVDGGDPYAIPPDNPFAAGGGAPEVWAFGFRNPFRWFFDPQGGALWAGDVGQATWEEIDLVSAGAHHGWPLREGAHCFAADPCPTAGLVDPVVEYSHEAGCAVIGGPVYRGTAFPGLDGAVLYSDFCSSRVWAALPPIGEEDRQVVELLTAPTTVLAFGQDAGGEALLLGIDGIFRLSPATGPEPPALPETLSATGCVDPADPKLPAPGLIPYDVNEPLWSDGAEKRRWLALPDGTRMVLAPDGDLALPIGSVAVKSFLLGDRIVETRLFMRHPDGGWAGYSYAWNEEQTEATLLEGAEQRVYDGQTWSFPSREQCMQCHTFGAGFTLGLEVVQLNRELLYEATGHSANQLETFEHIGLLDRPLPAPPAQLPALSRATLDAAARSYLHANCAGCHRPVGSVWTPNFHVAVPSSPELGICNVGPFFGNLGVPGSTVLKPGDPEHSLLLLRMQRIGPGQMPPLARSIVDARAVDVIDRWIRSWSSCAGPDADGDAVLDAADNCPWTANPGQSDLGGVGDAGPDGVGDACQCGDVDGNGSVLGSDATLIRRHLLGLSVPEHFDAGRCNVAGPAGAEAELCEVNDSTVIRRALLGLDPGIPAGHCQSTGL